jgi:uncharacterized protein involved in type VI secretion and phage assembly
MQWSRVRRYQRDNQKRKSKKERQYNILELDDTKGIIRSRKSKKDRQHNGLELEDTKGVIRSRKSKDSQHNGQKTDNTMF